MKTFENQFQNMDKNLTKGKNRACSHRREQGTREEEAAAAAGQRGLSFALRTLKIQKK